MHEMKRDREWIKWFQKFQCTEYEKLYTSALNAWTTHRNDEAFFWIGEIFRLSAMPKWVWYWFVLAFRQQALFEQKNLYSSIWNIGNRQGFKKWNCTIPLLLAFIILFIIISNSKNVCTFIDIVCASTCVTNCIVYGLHGGENIMGSKHLDHIWNKILFILYRCVYAKL